MARNQNFDRNFSGILNLGPRGGRKDAGDMVVVGRFPHGVIKQGGGEGEDRKRQRFDFSPNEDMPSHVNSNNDIV